MPVVASLTDHITSAVGTHGLIAVFLLMAVDSLLPLGGELIMLYAGVIAAGAISNANVALFGSTLSDGVETYVALSIAGTLGYLAGSLVGWQLGRAGGAVLLERHGHWLHLPPARVRRAERWFERHGAYAVLLGRVTPLVRSFISIPAGVFGIALAPYVLLTLLGSLVWCFAFAAAGWALGDSWRSFDHAFKYVDVAAVVAVVIGAVALIRRARR